MKRILVIFMLVSHGDPQFEQLVGNWRTSPSKSSKVNSPSFMGCNIELSFSPVTSSLENIPRKRFQFAELSKGANYLQNLSISNIAQDLSLQGLPLEISLVKKE